MSKKQISFILPHKGRENFLQLTLDSIINQDYDLSLIEVIIVTQNDNISDVTQRYGDIISLSIYKNPVTDTISTLRNFGVEKSEGDYLAFLDADIFLSNNWVSSMIDGLKSNSERALMSAAQISGENAPPLEEIRTALSNAIIDENVSFLPGRNLFLTRETFFNSGGFPEHLITCEDYYFTDKVHQIGKLYYTSKATYIHLGEDKKYGEMYRKEIWRGQSNLLSIKGRIPPLEEIPSFIVPIGIFMMLLLTVILLTTGYYFISAISFILFLLPILIYTLRLYSLAKHKVTFIDVLKFYLSYFPARAIGTFGGIFKTFSTKSHN